jgi:long-chain acyl-CoA synthetase
VVKKAGSGTSEEELAAWAKERLAAYKYPRVVQFADELPMTSTGKILKRELA